MIEDRKEFETIEGAMEYIMEYDLKWPDNPYMTRYKLWHDYCWHVVTDRLDSAD
jgi:hypothetical protein